MTIRNIDESVKKRLRMRAAENGRSLEAEARAVLGASVGTIPEAKKKQAEETGADLFDRIHRRFAAAGVLGLLPEPVRRGRRIPKLK
ncbi:MAG TPA: hypothetical protein VGF56_02505 [Rhizomicrobium sp.]